MRLPDTPLPAAMASSSSIVAAPSTMISSGFGDESTEDDYLNGSVGAVDFDMDGIDNPSDLCPLDADPNQENDDGDIRGNVCDCLPLDSGAWEKPPWEVPDLNFFDSETLQWQKAPDFFGATAVQYDTVRAGNPSDFRSAFTCVESGDGSDMQAVDASTPGLGEVFYYLIRARNACPNSEGSLGTSSDGTELIGAPCP